MQPSVVQELLAQLWRVGAQSNFCSAQERVQRLVQTLQTHFGDLPSSQGAAVVAQLGQYLGIASIKDAPVSTAAEQMAVSRNDRVAVDAVLADVNNTPKSALLRESKGGSGLDVGMLSDIEARLEAIGTLVRLPQGSVVEKLDYLLEALKVTELAMSDAAKDSFDRLFNAMAPETMQQSVRKSALTSTGQYHAKLWEAHVEKFQQLRLYHDRGRLVKDFRAAYRVMRKKQMSGQVDDAE